jgi:hypothetical protein
MNLNEIAVGNKQAGNLPINIIAGKTNIPAMP